MLLHHSFETIARSQPGKTALICGRERRTYGELESDGNRLARALIASHVGRGERVAISLPNGPELVIAVLAAMKAGGAFVVLNPELKPSKLASILQDCAPRVLITETTTRISSDPSLLRILVGDGPTIPTQGEASHDAASHDAASHDAASCSAASFAAVLAAHEPEPVQVATTESDLCYLLYTSGSTGRSKAVMMTHKNAVTAADGITTYLGLRASDVVLSFSPMASDYGLYNALMPLRIGATAVIEPRYLLPAQILNAVRAEEVTGLALVPTIIAMFLHAGELANEAGLESVRFLTSTGQTLPPAHIIRLRQLLPRCRVFSMYGLTECKRVSYLDPEELDRRPTSVGKAMPGTEVWLIDDTGTRIDEPHRVGELVIRGDHVMQGYWHRPDETAERLHPAPEPRRYPDEKVLHSGDLFEMDAAGFLYFVARADELIKSSGERISPREIEDCIGEIDGVTGVVVTAIPDPILGHAIHALVAIAKNCECDADTVRNHCAENLERPLVPKVVEIVDSIPQTLSGKLHRRSRTS